MEDDNGGDVIAVPADRSNGASSISILEASPVEIPPEPSGEWDEEDDEESDYEYEDEEDAAFSGFLVQRTPLAATSARFNEEEKNKTVLN